MTPSRTALSRTASPILLLALILAAPSAWAAGGAGGAAGTPAGAAGGNGGAANGVSGSPGATVSPPPLPPASGGPGGAGGTAGSSNGADGEAGSIFLIPPLLSGGGGGGGGGGYNGNGAGAATIAVPAASSLTGGNGGAGGAGGGFGNDYLGGGGGGGAGGFGAVVTGSGANSNSGTITGGNGGNGGPGNGGIADPGGGGDGGVGVAFTGIGATLTNAGTIAGGNGGAGGGNPSGGTGFTPAAPGGGGVGVIGSGLTIINSGRISGGLSGDRTTRANAIEFTSGNNTLTLESGSLLEGAIAVDSGTVTFNQSTPETLSTTITGAGAVIQNGAGTLTLRGANSYSGGTTVLSGLINFETGSNLGTGNVTLNGGGLQWAAGSTLDISPRLNPIGVAGGIFDTNGNNVALDSGLSGSGGVTKAGAGTLTLGDANSYTGATTITAATLALGSGGSIANSSDVILSNPGATLDLSDAGGPVSLNALDGVATTTVNLGAKTLTLTYRSGRDFSEFEGTIEGSGGVVIGGTDADLILTGMNTYTGGTTINSGNYLEINGAAGQPAGITGNVLDNGELAFEGPGAKGFAGVISGNGVLVTTGGTLTLSGANTYTGITGVLEGTLALAGPGSIAASEAVLLLSGSLDISETASGATVQALIGTPAIGDLPASTVLLGGKTLTVDIAGATPPFLGLSGFLGVIADGGIAGGTGGSLVKTGAGTLLLGNANTYTGPTIIEAGTLALETTAFAPPLSTTGSIADSSLLDLAGPTAVFDISKASNTTIHDLAGVAGSSVVLGANGLTFGTADSTVFAGSFTGTGGLTKQGSGTVTLNGDSASYGGTTTIAAGGLEVGDAAHPSATLGGNVLLAGGALLSGHGVIGGDVENSGAVAPGGSIGILTVNGNYAQSPAGSLNIEITPSATPGTGYDQLQVHGAASLAGKLLVLVNPGTYTIGARYDVLHAAGGVSGSFSSVAADPSFAGYLIPAVRYGTNDVELSLDPAAAFFNGGQQAADLQTAILGAAAGVGDAVLADGCGASARRSLAPEDGCVVHPLGAGFRSEAWLRGLGGIGNLYGSGARSSFTDNYGGMLIGYGIGFRHFTVGLGGGYLATGLNFSDGSSASQSAGLGFAYGRYVQGRLRVGGMAAYGGGQVNGSRVIPAAGLTAAGNRGASFGLFAVRAAYDVPLGPCVLEPRASFAYLHAHQGGFTETGASLLDLTYDSLNTDESDATLSLRLSRSFALQSWQLSPWIEAGVQETFSGTSRTASLSAGPFSATAAGVSPAPTAGTAGVGIRFAAARNVTGFLRYQGLFSANQTASAFSTGIRYRF